MCININTNPKQYYLIDIVFFIKYVYSLLLGLFPFLKGADAYFQTQTLETILVELNGRNIPVYNWKSKSEGVSVAVFE